MRVNAQRELRMFEPVFYRCEVHTNLYSPRPDMNAQQQIIWDEQKYYLQRYFLRVIMRLKISPRYALVDRDYTLSRIELLQDVQYIT